MSQPALGGRLVRRALVTGGAGFLGSWIVETLADAGVEVTVLDRTARPVVELPTGAELIHAELRGYPIAELLAEREIDAVFQLVGTPTVPPSVEHPLDDLRLNTESTLSVLEAARALDRPPVIVFTSSAAVYGESVTLPMAEDHPLRPISPYGISKHAAEQYVELYARMHAIPALSVRPFSLYGPRQRKLVVYDLLARIGSNEDPLVVLGSPDVSRDFVFAADAARMIVGLARVAQARGEAYNIASGVPVSLGELVGALVDLTGRGVTAHFTGEVRPGDPLHWRGDPSRAADLGVRTTTSLLDGLGQTIDWFRAESPATVQPVPADRVKRV